MESMDIDDALRLVGGYRRWHLSVFFMLGLTIFMPLCWQGLSIVFTGWTPPHHCTVPPGQLLNETIPTHTVDGKEEYQECHMYANVTANITTHCQDGWTYNSEYTSIVTEWGLVCDKNFLAELAQTIYQVGCLVGELFGAYLVDKYGRKVLHIVSSMLNVVLGIGVAFTQSYIAFVVVRALLGFTVTCCLLSGLTMLMELFDSRKRAFAGICLEYAWLVVYIILPGLAYAISEWRYFQLAISLGSVISLIYIFILPESAVWLAAQDRYEEAESVLDRMAKYNGVKGVSITLNRPPEALLLDYKKYMEEKKKRERRKSLFAFSRKDTQPPQEAVASKDAKRQRRMSRMAIAYEVRVVDLIRDPKLRRHTLIVSLFWFANNLVYYGLILSTPTLAGNRFLNFLIGAVVELPAYLLTYFIVDRYGRRVPVCVFHIIAGVALAVTAFIPGKTASGKDLSMLVTVFAMVAKFGITGSFTIIILYTRELFPTNLRATSSGLCNVTGRIGNMVAPFAAFVAKNNVFWLPNVTFAVISVIAGMSVFFLPETSNRPLPDTLDDIHGMYRRKHRSHGQKSLDTKT